MSSAHQVVTGALNRGEGVFSIGIVDGLSFIACAVGTNIVLLSGSFDRIQVITSTDCVTGQLVNCVDCCKHTGKIVASYGKIVRIFDAVSQITDDRAGSTFLYIWVETHTLSLASCVDQAHWCLQGLRLLLCCGDALLLYQSSALLASYSCKKDDPVTFEIIEEEVEAENEVSITWSSVWSQKLAAKPKYVSPSPDGAFFATSGAPDCMVKIWFQNEGMVNGSHEVKFDFLYLRHPKAVTGIEWRNIPRFMSRQCVQNALITWCEDNTARIWKETGISSTEFQVVGSIYEVASVEKAPEQKSRRRSLRSTSTRIKALLRKIKDKRSGDIFRVTQSSLAKDVSMFGVTFSGSSDLSPFFYLCATINAQNDCLLVPPLESVGGKKVFSVHWLNNKEIVYNIGVEKLLVDVLNNENSTENLDLVNSARAGEQVENSAISNDLVHISFTTKDDLVEMETAVKNSVGDISAKEIQSETPSVCSTETMLSKDSVDFNLDLLVNEWRKSADVLFAVHPIDGSLLTWSVDGLDDAYRQPSVGFSSRFPSAVSLTDATSLKPSLKVYHASDDLHSRFTQGQEISYEVPKNTESRISTALYLLTHHNNGTLNQWHLTVEENGKFNTILNISHRSRMYGHRYKISQVNAHPVLPLIITTSHYNYVTQEKDVIGIAELILWKVKPVGPLCKCGGIRELARITSDSADSFTAVAWLPAILPSSSFGCMSTSPSTCFVTNNSGYLNVYQAVVDAAGLLAEMHASDAHDSPKSNDSSLADDGSSMIKADLSKHTLKEKYKIVSTQSSTKPGCILLLQQIPDGTLSVEGVLLLHVFNERLLNCEGYGDTDLSIPMEMGAKSISHLKNRYYLVAFEDERKQGTRLRMWSVKMAAVDLEIYGDDEKLSFVNKEVMQSENSASSDESAWLQLDIKLVYDDQVTLPGKISIVAVEPAAGSPSSSNLYPACKTPYLVVLACSDEHVRFYECVRRFYGENDGIPVYIWRKWGMIGDGADSDIEMDGQIYAISSAHSSRFACAYIPEGLTGTVSFPENIKVGVFECESSGGVEWLREDTISVKGKFKNRLECSLLQVHGVTSNKYEPNEDKGKNSLLGSTSLSDIVCLKWVSAENGTHILTVAVGTSVYLYTQVSQGAAQRNIVMMKEHDTHRRAPLRKASSLANPETISTRLVRWLCIRSLQLTSADGLPPLPTTLGWTRDGLLIVGMQSEMRCYSQWNFRAEFSQKERLDEVDRDFSKRRPASQLTLATLGISPSHSMLDQLTKKQKTETSAMNKQRLYKNLLHRVYSVPHDLQNFLLKDEHVLDAISEEGLFEAARLASPILPQYHPKLLIELLNCGKTREVKAILLHVLKSLKQLNVSIPNPLSRASSVRRMSMTDSDPDIDGPNVDLLRGLDDDANLEYEELDGIAALPLHVLISASDPSFLTLKKRDAVDNEYSSLFDKVDEMSLNGLDFDVAQPCSRRNSASAEDNPMELASTIFTARHNRLLTEYLTHTHLPGLSSVDQMHLLAVADTLSHFSSDVMDKLTQANAAFLTSQPRAMCDAASGYATAMLGFETVDECGLRYLMAVKQHEYLLLCLPLKQKQTLRSRGLSSSHVIWALHSETETELLNAIPCIQKPTMTWEELRALGVAWWLKNTASLRMIIEKLAKAAFQKNQDPMDASLYYLLMKKKNVMAHLFKTVGNTKMADFFVHDFNSEDKWKKAALKNAFVLMGKQRFEHAAAFFLLAGSLKDALQTVLNKLQDLQLAMVIVRLYENDYDKQALLMKELLCHEVFGIDPKELTNALPDSYQKGTAYNRDPFKRSMAYWLLKDYTLSAATLLSEASQIHTDSSSEYSLSDIFNFYTFIRNHPLVIRQKLACANTQMASTETFLAVAKQMAAAITPAERRLYFRTASAHMASGCPLLALNVLMRLPKTLSTVKTPMFAMADEEFHLTNSADGVNCLQPLMTVEDKQLRLFESEDNVILEKAKGMGENKSVMIDVIAQHMKFIAALRILVEELPTLTSGFEIDGGQLRFQISKWLEMGVEVLKTVCDYRSECSVMHNVDERSEKGAHGEDKLIADSLPLHKALHMDRMELSTRLWCASQRRCFLCNNQKLLRAFTSYCTLHDSQNHRLTPALMEFLLLLMEVQQDGSFSKRLTDSIPAVRPFPLLVASVSPSKMFVSSPLTFIQDLCSDILLALSDIKEPPRIESCLTKVLKLYSLCQGLSSCLYQSLCDVESACAARLDCAGSIRQSRALCIGEDWRVTTMPSKWPGVDSMIALLSRERDDDAPQLRLLLLEIFIAVYVSLFSYALTVYDSRWLYRLAARDFTAKEFAIVFGGGGEKRQKVIRARSPAPLMPQDSAKSKQIVSSQSGKTEATSSDLSIDSSTFRAKFNAKMVGTSAPTGKDDISKTFSKANEVEQVIRQWVPPKKSMVQFFAEKPVLSMQELGVEYDSDDEQDEFVEESGDELQREQHNDSEGFAWRLLRLALVGQQLHRLKVFVELTGFEFNELPGLSPRVNAVFKLLESWSKQLELQLRAFPDGCPSNFLPDLTLRKTDTLDGGPLQKYSVLTDAGNTPFECAVPAALPVKRIWLYLAHQRHLLPIFIHHIFGSQEQEQSKFLGSLSEDDVVRAKGVFKIVHREHEPIASFVCNELRPGWIALATTKELQEMDISVLLDDASGLKFAPWVYSRVDLDVALQGTKKDILKDNDDYQLLIDDGRKVPATGVLLKRQVNGIRRMDSHPRMPYYVSGSSDGSIRIWEWGVPVPSHTARIAGQFAKVTKVSFSCSGNRFASVDNDGMLCLWQVSQGASVKKPSFSQKCCSKSAADVRFLGTNSSVLVTAGTNFGDENISLWDTLMPQSKSLVHSWTAHPEGATAVIYLKNHQSLVSAGRHGDLCLWDLRQRKLRVTIKCFENAAIKCLVGDPFQQYFLTGSSDGDIKVWTAELYPHEHGSLLGEHATKGGFSLRQVASTIQGVQQMFVDANMRLYSCGADCSLKIRSLRHIS